MQGGCSWFGFAVSCRRSQRAPPVIRGARCRNPDAPIGSADPAVAPLLKEVVQIAHGVDELYANAMSLRSPRLEHSSGPLLVDIAFRLFRLFHEAQWLYDRFVNLTRDKESY